jgi:transcriptional regulator with XRE-family HTH domain
VRLQRKSRALTIDDVAAKTGHHRNLIWKIEQGRGSLSTLKDICDEIVLEWVGISQARTLGEAISKERIKQGLTYSGLARAAKTSLASIRKVELDQGHLRTAERILAVLAPKCRRHNPTRFDQVHTSRKDVRLSPPDLMEQIRTVIGPIDLDPCGHRESHVGARRSYLGLGPFDDGLLLPWAGTTFCNPPYSDLDQWIRKAHASWKSGAANTVAMLIPARTNQAAFELLAEAHTIFLQGRIWFWKDGSTPMAHRAPFPSVLAIFTNDKGMGKRMKLTWSGLYVGPA